MCGRYASTRSAADLAALFEVEDLTDGDLVPDYNVAPTDPAPVVRMAGPSPVLCVARWGFLPHWARDASGAARMINARAETVAGSRAYGRAFEQRRCLVPADGWYEWRVDGTGGPSVGGTRGTTKRPYFMTRPERVVFGGLWSTWRSDAHLDDAHSSPTAESRITFSIVTMPAIGELASVHDRMPLVLDATRWRDWLSGSDLTTLLTPPTSDYCAGFEIRPVSAAVGDVRKDGPELVRRVTSPSSDSSTVDCSPTLF